MYFTLPIIEFDERIDIGLQQNVSDLIYGIFYSSQSEFKFAYTQGYAENDLFNSLTSSIENTVKEYESISDKYPYVIDSINVLSFYTVGDRVYTKLKFTSGALDLPVSLKIEKTLI